MIVMPADHVIEPREQFQAAIQYGCDLVEARPDRIVTFGITPTRPAEAFGYIERDRWLDESGPTGPSGCRAGVVRQFREKPDAATAREYLATGRFYWNSGIFIWKAQTILEALRQFEPEMAAHLDCIGDALGSDDADAVLDREFTAINGKSIDYAVMERFAGEICVVEAPFQWDDLGSWQASARRLGVDADGNTCVGRTLAIDSSGCILRTDDQHVVTTIGLRDCIVVHTPDATLVANKNDEESIRLVVAKLKELGWDEHL